MIDDPVSRRLRMAALRALTSTCSSFVLYKHVDDALAGRGDADNFVDERELSTVREVLIAVARDEGARLAERPYRPTARSFYLCAAGDGGAVVEIDVNVAPKRVGCTWLRRLPSGATEFRDGVRVATPPVEALGSFLYYHTRVDADDLPERERVALASLTADDLDCAAALARDQIGRVAGDIVARGMRQRHRALEAGIVPERRFGDRGLLAVLFLRGIVGDPGHLVRAARWRFGTEARARRRFTERFVRSGRALSEFGGWPQFVAACKASGGAMLVE
jgi:hypothetical protein